MAEENTDKTDKTDTTETTNSTKQEKKNKLSNDVWLAILFCLLILIGTLQIGYLLKKDMISRHYYKSSKFFQQTIVNTPRAKEHRKHRDMNRF